MITIEDLLQELEQEAATTRRVLERVPGDRLDWRPHDRSDTLGQLAMHVATIPGAIARIGAGDTFDVTTPIPRPSATSTPELLEALDRSVAEASARLREMDDAALAAPWRMVRGDRELAALPRGAFLRSVMLNHWYHHRGQLTVYLRQTGALVPAIYGGSADEAPALG
ncbi:MAG TPA: DinB family protein [Gemmatimonadaceae bacterium]|nr:DinB family protein [Gemmatimonadaceae bacterium]